MPGERPEFYKSLLDNLHDGVYFVDRNRVITYWNRAAAKIAGYEAREVIGHSCADNLLVHCTAEGTELCHGGCPVSQAMLDGVDHEGDLFLKHRDGSRVPVWVRASPLYENGKIVGAVEIFSNNSAKMEVLQRAEEFQDLAFVDSVTGLVNRRYLERRFAEEIGRFSRDGAVFAAAFMDVDHFKRANDQFGHEAGDAVLQTVARTLANNRRVGDVVGRWGGDEFVALLPQTDGPAAVHVAQRLRILVERSQTKWNGTILPVTISVGITTVRPGDNSETLLDRVDQLMYRSKQGGRNRVTSQF